MADQEKLTNVADKVAESTISANGQLKSSPIKDELQALLKDKLLDSHQKGTIDLEKFFEKTATKDRSDGRGG